MSEKLTGWSDMVDAPRDGTRILMSRSEGRERQKNVVVGWFNGGAGPKVWGTDAYTFHKTGDFNGWMPLPAQRRVLEGKEP